MGSDLITSTGAKGRRDVVLYDPEDLTIVTDKAHVFYDPRAERAVDDKLVESIMQAGVLEPIIVRTRSPQEGSDKRQVEVIAGRRRVLANRAANKRLKAANEEPRLIPCVIAKGSDLELFNIFVSENVHREDNTVLERAELMKRHLELGATYDQLGTTFGLTGPAIRYTLDMLKCEPEVKEAVQQGKIKPVLAAKELSKLPRGEQVKALKSLLDSGVTKGTAAKEAVREMRKTNGKSAPKPMKKRMRSRLVLERFRKSLGKVESKDAKLAAAVVAYMLGNDRALSPYPKLVEALA